MISSNSNSELLTQNSCQELDHLLTEDQDDSQEIDHLITEDQDDSQEIDHLITKDQDGSQEIDRLITKDQDGSTSREQQEYDNGRESIIERKRSVKLLLIRRIPWFITGSVVLVIALVLSRYHINLPYQPVEQCDDVFNDTNFTKSTDLYNDTSFYQSSIATL